MLMPKTSTLLTNSNRYHKSGILCFPNSFTHLTTTPLLFSNNSIHKYKTNMKMNKKTYTIGIMQNHTIETWSLKCTDSEAGILPGIICQVWLNQWQQSHTLCRMSVLCISGSNTGGWETGRGGGALSGGLSSPETAGLEFKTFKLPLRVLSGLIGVSGLSIFPLLITLSKGGAILVHLNFRPVIEAFQIVHILYTPVDSGRWFCDQNQYPRSDLHSLLPHLFLL